MRVLSVRFIEQIIFQIQGNGARAPRDITFGAGLPRGDYYTTDKKYEKQIRRYETIRFYDAPNLQCYFGPVKPDKRGQIPGGIHNLLDSHPGKL